MIPLPLATRAFAAAASCTLLCGLPLRAQSGCADAGPAAALGVRYRFVSGDFLTEPSGARWVHFLTEPTVTDVAADGLASGRLRAGDVVESIDGLLITTARGSRRFADVGRPGAGTVTLGVRRGGRALTLEVRPCAEPRDEPPAADSADVGAAPSEGPSPSAIANAPASATPSAVTGGSGMRLRCHDCRYRDGIWRFSSPPVVTAVRADGPAARAGLRVGDRLMAIEGEMLGTPAGDGRFSRLSAGDTARWTVERGGALHDLIWAVGQER